MKSGLINSSYAMAIIRKNLGPKGLSVNHGEQSSGQVNNQNTLFSVFKTLLNGEL